MMIRRPPLSTRTGYLMPSASPILSLPRKRRDLASFPIMQRRTAVAPQGRHLLAFAEVPRLGDVEKGAQRRAGKILPVDRLCQCRCHVGLLHGPYVPLLNKSQYFIRKDTMASVLDRGHHTPVEKDRTSAVTGKRV